MQAVQPLPFLADRQAAPLTNTFKSGELLRDAFKSGELLRDTFKSGELQRDTFKSNEVLPDETSWSLPSSGKPRPEAPLNQPAAPQRESKPPGSLAFELGRQRQKSVSLPEPSTVEDATPPEYALLPPIQTHNAVWYGPDMLKRKHEWFELLSLPEIAELETAARAWLAAHPDIPNTDIAIHSPDEFPLPTMKARLLSLRRELQHGRGFAVFHNLPVRRLTERELITIFSGIASYLGKPRSQNAQGDLVGNVRDAGLSSTDPNVRIYQTRERQGFHCDWADVVGLLCINPAMKGGQSLLCSSSTIWNEMRRKRPDLAAALLEPVATDRRGEVADGELPYNLVPVFNYYKGYLTALYHRPYIESAQRFPDAPRLTALQREAIEMFDQLAQSEDIHFEMRLGPGDMQFVYNHTLLHDRTAYEDWPSDTVKRHLLRVWVALPEDRPLPEVFASRYGSVEVGNRGGVKVTRPRPSAVAAPK